MDDKIITTADFISRLAEKGYTKKDSATIVSDVLDVIYNAMSNGEMIRITGFGTMGVKETSPREFRDIVTGETRMSKAHKKVYFKPGLTLARCVEKEE